MTDTVTTSARARLSPVGRRTWTTIALVGFVGRLAWTVENMYLNVFVYNTITTDPTVIALLVSASAVAATLATMLIGTASDRVRRRRPFIAVGYVLWGAATASFGFISPAAGATAAQAVGVAVVAVILLDCVMTFFGSGANDAAFNAWVTESTTTGNRGRVDGVLAIMPLVSMLVVFGALDGLTQAGEWTLFFGIVGGITAAVGIVAWFLVREPREVQTTGDGYLAALIAGLRPSAVRANPRLYVLLAATAVLGISTQIFLPYLIIYIQRYLLIDGYAVVLGSVLTVASIISVLGGRVIDRIGKTRALIPAVVLMAVGLVAMSLAREMLPVILAGVVMMAGFMLTAAALSASVRDATPLDRVGMTQGLRIVALVLIPMVVGPFIGAAVIIGANETYVDLGVTKQVPTPWMFVVAAAVALLVIVPAFLLRRMPAGITETAE